MKKFIVENAFWELFPQAKIAVVLVKGFSNNIEEADRFSGMLRESEKLAMDHLKEDVLSSNEAIAVWREAFKQFKTKKGARSSIEALLKRVAKGNELSCINPLVDIYNAISLKYALPCGGEDIATFEGDIRLTIADGDEAFITLGSQESAPPHIGEIVYKDEAGAICRCWNWRESVRTMLTEDTKDALLCIEYPNGERLEDMKKAMNELAERISSHLGGKTSTHIMTASESELLIEE